MPETESTEKAVGTVGSYLREVRESKGIGLEEAASVTRIGRNYLAAIEDGAFDKLPSAAYVKGFLRVYAGYLGLSGDEVVAMLGNSPDAQQTQPSRDTEKKEQRRRRKTPTLMPGRWLISFVLLAAVCVTAYIISDKEEETGRGTREPSAASGGIPVAARPAPVLPPRSSATQNPTPTVADSLKNTAVAADAGTHGGIILRLKVNQDCWLNITIDNAVSQQYDLKAGDLIEWKGEKVFTLDIGNAGGIEGEFNGKPLKPFGEPGKTAHVMLKAQNT